MVHYENPLPVAANVVLNSKREVLLVKRKNEPHRGMWCLPIGFAEVGETIAQAAMRELREETGVEAEIIRLLDANSFSSDFYGDLLIVTFELEKISGTEKAGDDAEKVEYFPLDQLPPLAFSSNEKALRICAKVHRDEWAIQDSYQRLQEEQRSELLSDILLTLVRDAATDIAYSWVKDVQAGDTTPNYALANPQKLFDAAFTALSKFETWLQVSGGDEEMQTFYQALGKDRRDSGFSLDEVLSALTLLRKHVWTHARRQGVWEKPIDVYRVLELNRRIVLFFDKAIYHTALGFGKSV